MEITMPAYSLCCLSSINLCRFVINPFTKEAYIDVEELVKTVKLGVRFLDNVLDATDYPLDKIKDFSKLWRRIGLGITGLGDMFAMLKIKYGSEASIKLSNELSATIMNNAYLASVELSKEKGAFPSYDGAEVLKGNFIKKLDKPVQDGIAKYGLRNIGLLTIAPTGCLTPDSEIRTSEGVKTIEEIFLDNDYSIKDLADKNGSWHIPLKEIKVETVKGLKRITKLFVNGEADTITAKTKSMEITATLNHKVLVKTSKTTAMWKSLEELAPGDKVLKKL